MRRRALFGTLGAAAMLSIAVACSSYGTDPGAGSADAGAGTDTGLAGDAPDDTRADSTTGPAPCANDAGVAAIDGGCAERIADGQEDPRFVVVAGTKVVWSSFGTATLGAITSADLDGSNAARIHQATAGSHPTRLAVNGSELYWGEASAAEMGMTGSVNRQNLSGGGLSVLASGIYPPRGIAATATRVYFATAAGEVYRIDLADAGVPPVTIFAGGTDLEGVAGDDIGVLFAMAGNDGPNPGEVGAGATDGGLMWEAVTAASSGARTRMAAARVSFSRAAYRNRAVSRSRPATSFGRPAVTARSGA